ncbi:rod shape-determining protein MreC [Candidatus Omnitrophota bacterium]
MLKSTPSPIKIVKFTAVIILIVLIAFQPSALTSVRSKLVGLFRLPLSAARNIADFAKRFIPFASYRDQIRRLKGKLSSLESEVAGLNGLRRENQRLKELLSLKKETPYKVEPAKVIARDPSNWADSVIIDKGRRHGVKPGAAAFTGMGLAGRVVESGNSSSKILLITDPNIKVGVIFRKNGEGGLLTGRSGGDCKIVYISLDAEVAEGDEVITAGYGGGFPKGISVGRVVKAGKEPGRLYKYAIVKPSQNLSKIEEILCVK